MAMISNTSNSPKMYFWAFAVLSTLWIALLVLFNRNPVLDIQTSSIFFRSLACAPSVDRLSCGSFELGRLAIVQGLRSALYNLPYAAAALIIAAIVVCYLSPAWRARLPLARLWISLISLGVSTGMVTNLILKSFSGRPRPVQADLFGGTMAFMPAGSFGGACQSNCSFISGEASGAGWMICLVMLLPPRIRDWVGPPLIVASIVTLYLRVAVGAHFLSDALLGWLLSVTVFCGLMTFEARFRSESPSDA
jgi:lipid A 4'-phosphatase